MYACIHTNNNFKRHQYWDITSCTTVGGTYTKCRWLNFSINLQYDWRVWGNYTNSKIILYELRPIKRKTYSWWEKCHLKPSLTSNLEPYHRMDDVTRLRLPTSWPSESSGSCAISIHPDHSDLGQGSIAVRKPWPRQLLYKEAFHWGLTWLQS